MYNKLAFRVYMICSGIVILVGFIMIFRQETTYADISSNRSHYKGNYTGVQAVIAGLIMGLAGYFTKLEIDKKKKRNDNHYEP